MRSAGASARGWARSLCGTGAALGAGALIRCRRYQVEALESHDQAIRLSPQNSASYHGRGNVLLDLERYQEALESYDEAIGLNPDDHAAYKGRGIALRNLGRYQEALESYDEAIGLNPDDDGAYNGRGIALRRIGRLEDALAEYDRARALNPANAPAANNQGVALFALSRFEDAMDAYDRAIEIDPAEATAHLNKGIALATRRSFDEALAELDTAFRLEPREAGEAMTWAAAILWHCHAPEQARERFALVKGRVIGCSPFCAAEIEAIAICGLGNPADAERHLLDAVHLLVQGDKTRPQAIYELLSDPPLPGIERLRSVVNIIPEPDSKSP